MGSGVAKQVREKFPEVFERYKNLCDNIPQKDSLLGTVQCICVDNEMRAIANLFAQDKFGYDGRCYTDYNALKECLEHINVNFQGSTVAIPYLMGCHRGGGDWGTVYNLIANTLVDCDVTLYEYTEGRE